MSSIDAGLSWADEQWEADLSVGPGRPVPNWRYPRTVQCASDAGGRHQNVAAAACVHPDSLSFSHRTDANASSLYRFHRTRRCAANETSITLDMLQIHDRQQKFFSEGIFEPDELRCI